MSRRVQVTFDCHDPVKTVRLWASDPACSSRSSPKTKR